MALQLEGLWPLPSIIFDHSLHFPWFVVQDRSGNRVVEWLVCCSLILFVAIPFRMKCSSSALSCNMGQVEVQRRLKEADRSGKIRIKVENHTKSGFLPNGIISRKSLSWTMIGKRLYRGHWEHGQGWESQGRAPDMSISCAETNGIWDLNNFHNGLKYPLIQHTEWKDQIVRDVIMWSWLNMLCERRVNDRPCDAATVQ